MSRFAGALIGLVLFFVLNSGVSAFPVPPERDCRELQSGCRLIRGGEWRPGVCWGPLNTTAILSEHSNPSAFDGEERSKAGKKILCISRPRDIDLTFTSTYM